MRELRGAGKVQVKHLPTEANTADMFTKILGRQPFERHRAYAMNLGVSVGVAKPQATRVAPPLSTPIALSDSTSDLKHVDIFDDQYDGYFFMGAAAAEPSHLLLSLAWHAFAAKTRTAPDIYSWQQMRGREWDEPKTVEVRTLERLGAYTI